MKKCDVCGCDKIRVIQMPMEYVSVCLDCGYGKPSNQTPIEYGEDYEAKYLKYPEEEICKIRLRALSTTVYYYRNKIKKNKTLSTLLDYGCGSGAFVKAAKRACYIAFGVDVNAFTLDLRPPRKYKPDILTAWDSFEHLTDAQQEEFFKTAENAKVIVISVPDFSTPKKDDLLNAWRHYRPGEHLHYYTHKSLKVRFEKEGLTLVYTSHAEDKVRVAPWKNNILTMGFVRGCNG